MGKRNQFDRVKQFVATGQAIPWVDNANITQDDLVAGRLAGTMLSYPAWEDTVMVNTVTTGSKILTMGDFRYFVIVDRIGMDIEIVSNFRLQSAADRSARDLLHVAQHLEGA